MSTLSAIGICIIIFAITLLLLRKHTSIINLRQPVLFKRLPTMIHRRVKFDTHFTKKEKEKLINALNIWKELTCGLFDYTIVDANIAITIYSQNIQGDYNTIVFLRAEPGDNLVNKIDYAEDTKIYGYAYYSVPSIILIVPDRLKSLYDFERIAIHEIGHLLNIGHISDEKSIMNRYYTGYNKLTQNDIVAFLSVCRWDYQFVKHTNDPFWIQSEKQNDKKRLKRFRNYKK